MRNGSFWPSWEESRLFTVLVAILLVYGIVFLLVEIKKTATETRYIGVSDQMAPTISVSGEGTASAAPDLREVSLTTSVTAATSDAAQDANSEQMTSLLASLRELGIADEDLETASYQVYPVYDYDVSPAVITGYTASQGLTVTIRDEALVSSVLAIAGEKEVAYIGDVRTSIEDTTALKAEARAEALREAYTEAAAIASAMGASLGRVVSYYESEGSYPYYYAERSMSAGMGGDSAMPELPEGESDVTVTVSVTYAIE